MDYMSAVIVARAAIKRGVAFEVVVMESVRRPETLGLEKREIALVTRKVALVLPARYPD